MSDDTGSDGGFGSGFGFGNGSGVPGSLPDGLSQAYADFGIGGFGSDSSGGGFATGGFDDGPDSEASGDSVDPEMEQMYQEFILEQSRNPHGRGDFAQEPDGGQDPSGPGPFPASGSAVLALEHTSCLSQSQQFNPTCGDEVTVRVRLEERDDPSDPTISSIAWDGHGCAISQASLSVMHDLSTGSTVRAFLRRRAEFHDLMDSRGAGLSDSRAADDLGDAMAFQGVSRFPMRIKCALLGWEAVRDAVARALAAMGHTDTECGPKDSGGEGEADTPEKPEVPDSGSDEGDTPSPNRRREEDRNE